MDEVEERGRVIVCASFVAHPLLDVASFVLRAHAAILHDDLEVLIIHPRGMRTPSIHGGARRDVAGAIELFGHRAAWALLPALPFGRSHGDREAAIVAAAATQPQVPTVMLTITPLSEQVASHIQVFDHDIAADDPNEMLDRALASLLDRIPEQPW
ncbi:hypothetical protein [Microbacterium sp. NPDC055683]